MTTSSTYPNRGGVDVICVEYQALESALRALRGCRGAGVLSRTLVRCGKTHESVSPTGIEVLSLPENPGFAAACNRAAARGGAEWILFLNPDCFPRPEDLRAMVKLATSLPEVAVLGPRFRSPDGRETRPGGVALHSLARAWERQDALPGLPKVDWVAGTCMLVRRRAFEQVRGFDESFFVYCEDADLCLRLGQRGWDARIAGSIQVDHLGGISFSSQEARRRQYQRGREIYMRKHAGVLSWFLWKLLRKWKDAA